MTRRDESVVACAEAGLLTFVACAGDIEVAGGAVPDWVQIIKTGIWHGRPQVGNVERQDVTTEHLAAAQAWFDRNDAAAGIVVDYHHASLFTPGVRAPAGGWIRAMELRANGAELWGKVLWVTETANEIATQRYRRLSPVLRFGAIDPKTGDRAPMCVHSVALTNTPHMPDLMTLNQAGVNNEGGGKDASATDATAEEGADMKLLDLLANALGLTPAEVAPKLGLKADAEDKAQAEALVANAARLTELEGKVAADAASQKGRPIVTGPIANAIGVAADADEKLVLAGIEALKRPADMGLVANALGLPEDAGTAKVLLAVQQRHAAAQADEAETLVANAVAAGKIAPALRQRYVDMVRKDLPAGRQLIEGLGVVTRAQADTAANQAGAGGENALTDNEQHVCRLLGITEKEFAAARA